MPVYTVHAPVTNGDGVAATDRFAFVRDGFHVWAALLAPVWLAWHRLWLALIGWIVVVVALDVGMAALGWLEDRLSGARADVLAIDE